MLEECERAAERARGLQQSKAVGGAAAERGPGPVVGAGGGADGGQGKKGGGSSEGEGEGEEEEGAAEEGKGECLFGVHTAYHYWFSCVFHSRLRSKQPPLFLSKYSNHVKQFKGA